MDTVVILSILYYKLPVGPTIPRHIAERCKIEKDFICLFVFRLNVPVNNFSAMSGWSQLYLGLTSIVGSQCLAQGHNTMTLVGI